jgi:molybdopterin-containing oxidoreductase family membrane subunit
MQAAGHITLAGRAVPVLGPRAAGRAVADEIRSMPLALRLWLAGLLAVMAVAAIAALIALPPGWEVFGTTPAFEWGLMIIGYVFFAVMTSGLCLASSLGTVFGIERFRILEKRHAILAVLSLTTAFGIIALDLHYPVRMVLGAVFVPAPSSPMWWMGVFYGAYLVVLLIEVWSMFWHRARIHQYACTSATIIAVLAPSTLGAVFAVLAAKPLWSGPWTVIGMLSAAYLAGTALLAIVFYPVIRFRLDDWERARRFATGAIRLLLTIALVLVSALLVRHLVAGLTSDTPGVRESMIALVSGPLAAPFWILRVIVGLALPLVLVLVPMARTPAGLAGAGIAALVGVFVDRYLFVAAGQITTRTAHSGVVSDPYAWYAPSLVEIAIIAGAVALFAFVYTLAERYLDMTIEADHTTWPWPWLRHHHAGDEDAADGGHADEGRAGHGHGEEVAA